MRREDMERLAFLYLCEEGDRNILEQKKEMNLKDFLKFEYWTRLLGFWEYHKILWSGVGGEFRQELEDLGIEMDGCREEWREREEAEIGQLEKWEEELKEHLKKLNIEYL